MNRSFTDLAFFFRTDYTQVNLTRAETPERVQSALVSGNFFQVIGVMPANGRIFNEDDLKLRSRLVILGAGLANRRFGQADPVGQTIRNDGRTATVIGVMPSSFHFPNADTEVWEPYTRIIPYQPSNRDADYLCSGPPETRGFPD